MRTFTFFVLLAALAAVAVARPQAQDEVEYYDEEADAAPAPAPSTTARPSLLNRGRAVAPLRKPSATKKPIEAATTTTTTTTTAAPSEEEYDDQPEGGEAGEEPTTKKYLLAGRSGVVRPFRSNDDLIAALKRRRAQSTVSTHAPAQKESTTFSPTPTKSSNKNKANAINRTAANLNAAPRKRFNPSAQPVSQSVDSPAAAPAASTPSRPRQSPPTFNKRTSQRSRAQEEQLAAEDAEESQTNEEVQQPARPSRSFTPRRRS